MNQTIEVIVASNGAIRVETKGFAGTSCRDASRELEQALGHQAGEQLTVEFHQVQPIAQATRQRS